MTEKKTFSISVRLRRTITEEAFVLVPVTEAVKQDKPDEEGRFSLDADKVMNAAINLGSDPATRWKQEGPAIVEVHPIQSAPPANPDDAATTH
jgi:hypothetical protein